MTKEEAKKKAVKEISAYLRYSAELADSTRFCVEWLNRYARKAGLLEFVGKSALISDEFMQENRLSAYELLQAGANGCIDENFQYFTYSKLLHSIVTYTSEEIRSVFNKKAEIMAEYMVEQYGKDHDLMEFCDTIMWILFKYDSEIDCEEPGDVCWCDVVESECNEPSWVQIWVAVLGYGKGKFDTREFPYWENNDASAENKRRNNIEREIWETFPGLESVEVFVTGKEV